jgi:CheY-like chemotaxis protein
MALRFRRAHDGGETPHGSNGQLADELDVVERVRSKYPPGSRLHFGAPTRCPRCSEYGLVDDVDLIAGTSANHCLKCGTEWTISVRALVAMDSRRTRRAVTSSGTLADLRRRRKVESRLAPDPAQEGVRFTREADGEVVRRPVSAATRPLSSPADEAHWEPPPLPLRVLLVEDDPDDIELVRQLVEPAGPDVIDLRTATTRAAGEVAARTSQPDIVLLDLGLPDSHGVDTLTEWRQRVGETPVLVVCGGYEAEVVDRGQELGVAGVLDKAALARYLEQGEAGTTAFLDLLGNSSGTSAERV